MHFDLLEIPLTTNKQESNKDSFNRWDKQKGHFSLTMAALLTPDKKSVNLRQSIMPLGKNGTVIDIDPKYAELAEQLDQGNPELITQTSCPEIRMAFTTMGRYTALSSHLQAYANKHLNQATIIGMTAFWQPKSSCDYLFASKDSVTIANYLTENRKLEFSRRGYIDAHNIEVADILEKTRDLMIQIVLDAGLKFNPKSIANKYKPQQACSILANRYPFILQHVFKRLPNLNILKLGLNVLGSDNGLYIYRHIPEWFSAATILRTSTLRDVDLKILV